MPESFQFPQNRDVMEKESEGIAFKREWLGFLNRLYDRLKGADSISQTASAAVSTAPGAYDQTHIQALVDASNEHKQKIDAILAALQK